MISLFLLYIYLRLSQPVERFIIKYIVQCIVKDGTVKSHLHILRPCETDVSQFYHIAHNHVMSIPAFHDKCHQYLKVVDILFPTNILKRNLRMSAVPPEYILFP